jgi:ribosomal-protein-serine acetyltransferase
MSTPPIAMAVGTGFQLRALRASDAGALLAAVDADRALFETWLRWAAGVRTLDEATAFIAKAIEAEQADRGFHLGLWDGDQLVGGFPCWSIDPVHRVAELGYWLGSASRGSGLAATATRAVMAYLFDQRQVNRIEFQCRVENAASRRTAERVGGQLEGIRRQSHWVGGAFRDHAVYAVLATEWSR